VYFTRQSPETFITTETFITLLTSGKAKNVQEFFALIKDPGFDHSSLGKTKMPFPSLESYSPLDLSNVPRFQWQPLSLGGELRKITIQLSTLILAGVVLFFLSYISFVRYDVR